MATYLKLLHQIAAHLSCLSLLSLTVIPTAAAQRAESRDGSIYLTDESGTTRKLTNSIWDQSPSVSANGEQVVYVRSRPTQEAGDEGAESEIRIYDLSTGTDQTVLRG